MLEHPVRTCVSHKDHMNLRAKVLLLAILPLVLAVAAIILVVNRQAEKLSDAEIAVFEKSALAAKQAELLNYVSLALTSIDHVYNVPPARQTPAAEARAQATAKRILDRLSYGRDGYFFVYDFEGRNLVHPKQPWRVGKSYINLKDPEGRPVIQGLIEQARNGGGYFHYTWEQPSTGKLAAKIGYAVALDRWGWMLGTGIYVGDVAAQVALAKAETKARIHQTFVSILGIALAAIFAVFATGVVVNMRETQLANERLRGLTHQIVAAQEDERARVSRELHDGISQILVSVKFALERAQLMLAGPAAASQSDIVNADLERANANLREAIGEVRRVAQGLRPGMLDDLGLENALQDLTDGFATRTGISVTLELADQRPRLAPDVETALYRIAQETLANVEQHARATTVTLSILSHRNQLLLEVVDNGRGFNTARQSRGLAAGMGLENMEKRLEPFDGDLQIVSRPTGTRITARLPLARAINDAAKPRPIAVRATEAAE
jgi:two-component system NarL family sensor kinase